MSRRVTTFDGLWRCLRPSFDSVTFPRSIARLADNCPRYAAQSQSPSQGNGRNAQCQRRAFNVEAARQPIRKPAFRRDHRELWGRELLELDPSLAEGSTASEQEIYKKLQLYAAHGMVANVTAGVNLLIKERKQRPSLFHYGVLILANVSPDKGSATAAASWYEELLREGFEPDSGICHDMLAVLAVHPDYSLRERILDYMRERWFSVTPSGEHNVIAGMLREKQFELALERMDRMCSAGVPLQSWLGNKVIHMLCEADEVDEALRVLAMRVNSGDIAISDHLWYHVLDTASRAYHHDATLYVWRRRVEPSLLNPPSGMCLNVLATAARHGNTLLATDVFRILGNRATVFQQEHYEMLFDTYVNAGDLATAIKTLCLMEKHGFSADDFSTRTLFRYVRQNYRVLQRAIASLNDLHSSGQIIPISAVNCVIDGLVYQEDLNGAFELYKRIHELCPSGPTTSTFNSLLRGCSRSVRKDLAMFLVAEMKALKCAPDQLTFDRLMLTCLDAGDVDDAWNYYDEMRAQGLAPRQGTLVAIIRHSAKAGNMRVWDVITELTKAGMASNSLLAWLQENWKGAAKSDADESEKVSLENPEERESENIVAAGK